MLDQFEAIAHLPSSPDSPLLDALCRLRDGPRMGTLIVLNDVSQMQTSPFVLQKQLRELQSSLPESGTTPCRSKASSHLRWIQNLAATQSGVCARGLTLSPPPFP